MRLIHLSDLHLGKRVNGFSMLEDQRYILKEILRIIDEERPDAVLISGDVYDKAVPSAEAVLVLDEFLCRLAQRKLPVLMISGNHAPVNDQRGKGSFLRRMLLSYDSFWNSARTSLLVLLHRLPQFLQGFFLQAGDVGAADAAGGGDLPLGAGGFAV